MRDFRHNGDVFRESGRVPNFRLREPEYVAVVGGREMSHDPVHAWMEVNLTPEHHVIVTGDARGADEAARAFASAHGFVLVVVPADHLWKHYHNGAGMLRNPIIARLATEFVVAFPDLDSRGTYDTTGFASGIGKTVIFPLGNGQGTIFDHGVLE